MRTYSLIFAAAALALAPAIVPAARADDPFQVVMTGLSNPYGLAFGPNGALYVAEAGTGGATAAFTNGNGVPVSFGDTGAVAELYGGTQSTPITNLASLAPASGVEATGLQGLAFDASGNLYGVFGLGGTPADLSSLETTLGPGSNESELGALVSLDPGTNTATVLNNVAAYETAGNFATDNPGETDVEANPYDLTLVSSGHFAVTDGGGNVVLNVPTDGSTITKVTALAPTANPEFNGGLGLGGPFLESVPTAITSGPGGDLYVGEYTGFPFPQGAADVFQVNPVTGKYTPYVTGLTGVTGLAFGPNGYLYIVDQTTTGLIGPPSDAQIIQYDVATGTQSVLATLAPSYTPTDIAVGPDDALYVSTLGTGANTGQVLRFALAVPEPSPLPLIALAVLPLAVILRRRCR